MRGIKMPKQSYDVIVHGYVCIDNIVKPSQGVKPGSVNTSSKIHFSVGGVDGNTGTALANLGKTVYISGRVGKDARAASLRRHFELLGVECDLREDPNYDTSVSIIFIDPKTGERTIYHNPEANRGVSIDDISDDTLCRGRHYHYAYFGLSDGVDIPGLLRRAKEEGLTTSFDTHANPTEKDKPYFEECAEHATLIFPSYSEIRGITGLEKPGDICNYLISLGPKLVGIKLGDNGAVMMQKKDDLLYLPPFDVEVVSTLAAGDSFYAGIIDAYLDRKEPLDILRWANAVAAACVQGISTEQITRKNVETIIAEAPLKSTKYLL